MPVAVPVTLRRKLRALVRLDGADAAAEKIGIARHTFNRALEGLPVQRATLAMVRAYCEAT